MFADFLIRISSICCTINNPVKPNYRLNFEQISLTKLMSISIFLKSLEPFKHLSIFEIYKLLYIWKINTKYLCRTRRSLNTYLLIYFIFFKKTKTITLVNPIVDYNSEFSLVSLSRVSKYSRKFTTDRIYSIIKKMFKVDFVDKSEKWTYLFNKAWEKKINIYNELEFLKKIRKWNILSIRKYLPYQPVIISQNLINTPKYSTSSINKYIPLYNTYEFQFLRKNKVYNKGRYSRCRQNYRTGVYMCIYLSILSLFGLYYWFYKFSFNFTYLWWFFIAFLFSFFLPKIIKYRLYNPRVLVIKAFEFFRWIIIFIESL